MAQIFFFSSLSVITGMPLVPLALFKLKVFITSGIRLEQIATHVSFCY